MVFIMFRHVYVIMLQCVWIRFRNVHVITDCSEVVGVCQIQNGHINTNRGRSVKCRNVHVMNRGCSGLWNRFRDLSYGICGGCCKLETDLGSCIYPVPTFNNYYYCTPSALMSGLGLQMLRMRGNRGGGVLFS